MRVRMSPLLQKGSRPLPGSDRPPQTKAAPPGDILREVVGGSRTFSGLSPLSRVPSMNRAPICCRASCHTHRVCVWQFGQKQAWEWTLGGSFGLWQCQWFCYGVVAVLRPPPPFPMYWLVSLLHHISPPLLGESSQESTRTTGEKKSVRISLKFKLPTEVSLSIFLASFNNIPVI